MFLRDPARIEGLLCCHFIAMLIQALIERHIRTFHPELTDLQRQVLDLLDIPTSVYTPAS